MDATIGEWLARAAIVGTGGLRFVERDESERWLPWSTLQQRAARVAASLREVGVGTGDRVALIHPTGEEFFEGFFGAILAGGVPVPLYPPVRLGRLEEFHRRTAAMVQSSGAALVLADRRVKLLLGEVVERARPRLGCRAIAELPAAGDASVPSRPDDLALVQFSSGTTMEPKPVALAHRALTSQVRALNGFWPDGDGLRHSGVSWLPLYHDMGLIGCVLTALERPSSMTLIPPELFVARPALWLRAISRHRATVSPAPNFAYGLCLKRIRDDELDGVDLSCWRMALNGAESVSPDVLRGFQRRFARWGFRPEALTPVYGLSEASLAVTFSRLDRRFLSVRFQREALAREGRALRDEDGREVVSVGSPLPGFGVDVRDGAGRALPERRVGRVWVTGPSLMTGYLNRPDETARVLRDGWLDTGDRGFVDGGELFLVGREKDVVIMRGRNFAPEEIEHALDGVGGVRSGCSVAASYLPEGLAGADGERMVVLVERARGFAPGDDATIAAECRQAILGATTLEAGEVVVLEPGTLPRTSSGKLRRGEALAGHLDGTLAPPGSSGLLAVAGAMVRSRLAFARARRDPDR